MKLSGILTILGLVLTAGSLLAADASQTCNLATLKGDWGLVITGTRPSAPNGPIEQAIGTLIRRYDGVGGFTQVDNVHGAVSGHTPDRPGKGTYTVNADCSGVAKLDVTGVPIQPEERFVIVDDGNGILSATSNPPTLLIAAQGRRLNSMETAARAAQADTLAQLFKLVNAIAFRMGLTPAQSN
jgi:hypothetical protein